MNLFSLRTLSDYTRVHELPSFVKEAGVITEKDIVDLPQQAFADTLRNLPTHTKAATWLSALAFHAGDIYDPTGVAAVKLEKAASFWGIGEEYRKLIEHFKKTATIATDDDFALVVDIDGGSRYRRFPIRGPQNIKESAVDLEKSAAVYPWPLRKQAAAAILKRASELKIALDNQSILERVAGLGIGYPAVISDSLLLRSKMVKDAELRTRLEKLAFAAKTVELKVATLEKLAMAIDVADRAGRLYQYYGTIQTPEELCFGRSLSELQEKRASFIELTTGKVISKEALTGTDADRFAALGDDFVNAIKGEDGKVDIKKAEELVPTLPADDARLFANSL
jgi:hypothetical protein